MDDNLKRPRPAAWGQGSLFPFIEDCWGNSIATAGNKNIIASRLHGKQPAGTSAVTR